MSLTQAIVRQFLDYNPATGVFTWKPRSSLDGKGSAWNTRFAGRVAGNVNKALGYVMIDLCGAPRYAHRLAFIWMQGEAPKYVDHANRNKSDNSWSNLRACTAAENGANRPARQDSLTGMKGVTLHRRRLHQNKPYQARMDKKSLGYFSSAEEAHAAYMEEARVKFGEFARAA